MRVYCVITEDRHTDTQVEVYADKQVALNRANQIADMSGDGDYDESDIAGWLYFATYSCEGDSVRVIERTMEVAT